MFRWLMVSLTMLLASWAILVLLARRLPPGLAKDLATILPACATTARRLRRDPRVSPASPFHCQAEHASLGMGLSLSDFMGSDSH